jgi:serine/threonine protein kinase
MTGGTSVDWWTMGILMHEMLTGRSPWKSETQNAVLAELRGKAPVKLSKELSPRAAAIISGLVTRNPRKRLGHRGATELKSHPFFWPRLKQSSDWSKLYNRGFQPPIRPCKTKIKPPPSSERGTGVRESGEQALSGPLSPKPGETKKEAKERADAWEREKAAFQKQYGTQNFEKSQRNLAIKAVAFPDPSNEGSVGYEFEGFTVAEGGPNACLRIKDSDMVEIKRLVAKQGR